MLYILVFVLLLATELAYFRIAERYNIIDKPNKRSSHTRITLRGGGIIFYFGVLFYFLLNGFMYPWFLVGLTLISFISFADDVKPRSSRRRIFYHFVAMSLMFYQLGLFQMPGSYTIVALIFCTGVLNAYNFMDGINGLTSGYSMVVIGALWYINTYQIPFVDNNLLYILLMALLVFNFFNFRKKAKCFAGDVGAISIAFTLVYLFGLLILKTKDISYVILLGLYGVDAILTIIHRLMLKENIFHPHREHLYQIMANEMKIPHVMVAGLYCLVQALIDVGFLLTPHRYLYLMGIIVIFSMVYVLFMKKYFHLHKQN